MRTFAEDLQAAAAYHGHLCNGMFIGVRMSRYALKLLEIEEPLVYKDLIVYTEIDRCASDAVCVVTGCTMGRKRLKLVNYGKLAATFVDLGADKAIRLSPNQDVQMPDEADPYEFWARFTDEELFKAEDVSVDILPRDLPGKPQNKAVCYQCKEKILDGREIEKDGQTWCLACADKPYYSLQKKNDGD